MIPMSELVKDPVYRRYLQSIPELPPIARSKRKMQSPPWVVYVQKRASGPWGKKEFWKYSEAFHFLKRALKAGVHDATINCRRVGFEPPSRMVRIKGKYIVGSDGVRRQAKKLVYWRPKLDGSEPDHYWCKYCRRPTEFKYFRKHKALKSDIIDPTIPRCCICGASSRIALLPHLRRY